MRTVARTTANDKPQIAIKNSRIKTEFFQKVVDLSKGANIQCYRLFRDAFTHT
jgi:hypothetical protein